MEKAIVRQLLCFLMVFLLLPLYADEKNDETKEYHFFSESLILYLPLPGAEGIGAGVPERNIYPFGIGGGIAYETTLLNRIFSDTKALPGIVIGCSAAIYMMEPQPVYSAEFGELAIITAGIYSGYEFLIPVTDEISVLPVIAAGVRYYISFHFFLDELSFAYDPIVIGRAGVRMVWNRVFSLLMEIEYQVFMEYIPRQTLSISFGSGIFF